MPRTIRVLFILGSAFTLIGSFLPWRMEGDFLSYTTYGIRIFPVIRYYTHARYVVPAAQDNGGLLVVVLTLFLLMLVFRAPGFIPIPRLWSILLASTLVLISIFHVLGILVARSNQAGNLGAPTIQFGLAMVAVGAVILLGATILPQSRLQHS